MDLRRNLTGVGSTSKSYQLFTSRHALRAPVGPGRDEEWIISIGMWREPVVPTYLYNQSGLDLEGSLPEARRVGHSVS